MSKFQKIKKGDTVFVDTSLEISNGWSKHNHGNYFLPATVTHVTPKFFEIKSYQDRIHKIRKDNGNEHGGLSQRVTALELGEVIHSFKDVRTVKDETKEYLKGVAFVNLFNSVNYLVNMRMDASKVTMEQLEAAFKALNDLPKREPI